MVLDARNKTSAPVHRPGRPRLRVRRPDAERRSLVTILNLVRCRAARTRQDIERQSGLGRAVVARRLETLMDVGLVEEGELAPAKGGRAPRLVQFRADAGLVLVAVLDRSTIGVGVADLSGRLKIEHHEAADPDDPEATLKRLATLFDWMLDQHKPNREVWGIGLAVPGPVELADDQPNARPTFHFMPGWDQFPLVESLIVRHKVPVWVRSNVQMMTLGEATAGISVGARNALFVKFGKSINAGLISEGHFHRGAQGAAGLIGHIPVDVQTSVVCRCGNRGCLEVAAGEDAIVREAVNAAREGHSRLLAETLEANGEISATDVAHAAQLGDSFSAELLSRCGRLVGTVLASLANAFNPSLIILTGGIVQGDDIFLAAIREAVYRRSHPLVTRDLRVTRSQMGNSAGLVGSAMVAIDGLFETELLGGWIGVGSPLRHPRIADSVAEAQQALGRAAEQPHPPLAAAKSR